MNANHVDTNYAVYSPYRRPERKPQAIRNDLGGDSPSPQHDGERQSAPSVDALLSILQEEIDLHEQILEKKKQERPCLATGAVTELQKITGDLQQIIDKIQHAEQRRTQELKRWGETLGIDPARISVRTIAQHLPEEKRETLIQTGDRLKTLVLAVRDQNNMNQLLLKRSMRLLNDEIRVLFNTDDDESISYTSRGSITQTKRRSSSHLVDCRV